MNKLFEKKRGGGGRQVLWWQRSARFCIWIDRLFELALDQIWLCWSRCQSNAVTISWAQPDSLGRTAPYESNPDLLEVPGETGWEKLNRTMMGAGWMSGTKKYLIIHKVKVKVKSLSRVRLLVTPWTAAYQAPPSMGFSRQEYWSGCHCLLRRF